MTPLLRPIVARINGLTSEIKRIKTSTKLDHAKKQHTINVLKSEARHTMLAYAFIRRVPYSIVEADCNEKPDTFALARIIAGFGISRKHTITNGNGRTYSRYGTAIWSSADAPLIEEMNEWLGTTNQKPSQPEIPYRSSLIKATLQFLQERFQ